MARAPARKKRRKWPWIVGIVLLLILIGQCAGTSESGRESSSTTSTATTGAAPSKLDGHQEYQSAHEVADDLNALGRQCDMAQEGGNDWSVDSGRCYLGGSAGEEIVIVTYASQAKIDEYLTYITPKLSSYGYLMGNKWTVTCDTRALCDDLQAALGGSINASANLPPGTPIPTAAAPRSEEVADTAQRWILGGLGQLPPDGSFKKIGCPPENPDNMQYCWLPYINNFTYSDGVLFLHMDTDWTQQPDAARMVTAQNGIRNNLQNGPAPDIVMNNVHSVQSMDRNGLTRSDAPLG